MIESETQRSSGRRLSRRTGCDPPHTTGRDPREDGTSQKPRHQPLSRRPIPRSGEHSRLSTVSFFTLHRMPFVSPACVGFCHIPYK